MNKLEKLFLDKTKEISFIELKKDSNVEIKGYKLDTSLPLPIITETLMEDIKHGEAEDEISILNIINGIIYLLGTDKDFIHNEKYKEILFSFDNNIEDFILYNGLEYLKKEEFIKASIYLRTIIYLKRENPLTLFNYSMALENILNTTEDEELKTIIFNEITNNLEKIIDIDEKFALTYYKLGFYYRHSEQFVKTKLIWEKYLKLEDDAERKDEIREELLIIENDIEFEETLVLLTQGQYSMALEKLLKISKTSNWWNIYYLIGICYQNLNETEKAIEYFQLAIDNEGENVNVYNEMAIAYFTLGDPETAIENLNIGIDLDPDNYEVYFNRGMVYQQLGLIDRAIEDIERAYEINPSQRIKEHLESLKII